MANQHEALSANAEGNFFVDSSCINCGVSRHYAPEIFGDTGAHAFVKRQPQNAKEEFAAKQALLACPAASIGMRENKTYERCEILSPFQWQEMSILTASTIGVPMARTATS